jgi:hypothetical protein
MLITIAIFVAVVGLSAAAICVSAYFFGSESDPWNSTDLQAQREFGRWKQRKDNEKAAR